MTGSSCCCLKELTSKHFETFKHTLFLVFQDINFVFVFLLSVMFERLAKNGRQFEAKTQEHVNQYADAGLRTLILAYREVDENDYIEFNKSFNEAKASVSEDREALIDDITDKMERDLILLGATAVEDKLQNGV